jgi:hypothetical protein
MAESPRGQKERGQILVLFEIVLIVILVFAALVIDLGFLRNDRQMVVNAVDAGALAGGTVLPVTGPDEADKANSLIALTVRSTFPALQPTDYHIEYKCLVPANESGVQLNYIPSSCDPRPSLLGNPTASVTGLEPFFVGAGPHRYSSCNPVAGDKCNVVVVTASKITKFNIGPVIGVDQGSTGSISSAACQGVACGAVGPPQPVDLVIILDRTGSMADSGDPVGAKIHSLQMAAETVLSVYDPAVQRVALGLTGPGKVNASGVPVVSSCSPGSGSAAGVYDGSNYSPRATLTTTGTTNLFTGAFLNTTLKTAMTTASTTVTVASAGGFPTSGNYTIQIDTEQMLVTGGQGTTTWTVTRGYNSTTKATHAVNSIVGWAVSKTDTTLKVSSAAGFPTTGSFTIKVDNEQMLVTAGQGTTTWTVTRGYNSTTTALHGGNEPVSLIYSTTATTITVDSASGFPTSGTYTIKVDSEYMRVTGGQGTTTWTVTRRVDGTSAATHTGGASVTRVVGTTDTSIQVTAPYGPSNSFPAVPFTISVGSSSSGSGYEHMLVTAVSGSSAPYTWTVTRARDNTAADTHTSGELVHGVAAWVPGPSTVGMWVPVGTSGTDSDLPAPVESGIDGTYSIGGVVQPGTPIDKSINCISAIGGTDLATPIRMAQWYLDTYGRPGVTQGIILETDGKPQNGFSQYAGDQTTTSFTYTCQATVNAAAAAKADTTKSPNGIQIFTIGYGVTDSTICPKSTTSMSAANGTYNYWESSTWSGKPATKMLEAVATDSAHYFENPSSDELAGVFAQAATELVKGSSRLIQLYPAPVVTSVGGSPSSVSIGGQYFTGATKVYFGASSVSFSVGGDSSITATPPTLPSGTVVPVTVTTPGGTSIITGHSYYTYP